MGLERGAAAAAATTKAAVPASTVSQQWTKGLTSVTAMPEPAPSVNHTLASYFMLSSSKSDSKQRAPAPAAASAAPAAVPSPWQQGQLDFPPVSGAPSQPAGLLGTSGSSAWPATDKAASSSQAPPGQAHHQRPAIPPPPPPPRQPTPPPVSSSFDNMTSQKGNEGGTVGLDCGDGTEDLSKLTKAQRKNLKRAERKNRLYLRTRGGQDGEAASDEDDGADDGADEESDAGWTGMSMTYRGSDGAPSASTAAAAELKALRDAERVALMEDMFVQALVCRKAMLALRDVQRLSFSWWQAAAAVQRFGGDLASGVAWLLERGHAGVEDVAVMPLTSGAERGGWPDMDLTEELQRLSEVQSRLGITVDRIQAAVVEAVGDVPRAVEILLGKARGPSTLGGETPLRAGGGGDGSLWGGSNLLMQSDPVWDGPESSSAGVPLRGLIGSSSQQDLSDGSGSAMSMKHNTGGAPTFKAWATSTSLLGQGFNAGQGLSGGWQQQLTGSRRETGEASSPFGGFVQQDTSGSGEGSSRFAGLWGSGR